MDEQTIGRTLLEAFAKVPDPRRAEGRRHPLPAILALATAAMLAGARSLYAIAQWGRLQDTNVVHALGFSREKTPAVSSIHAVFSRLDVEAFEHALSVWAEQHLGDRGEAIAVDGKGLRGIHDEKLPGVRLIAAYAVEAGLVLAQSGVRVNQHEAELTAAPALLDGLSLAGRIATFDALYCQRPICQSVVDRHGDYLIIAKRNLPRLFDDIALLFADPPAGEVFGTAEQRDRHGDRHEIRKISVSTALRDYLDWPGVQQVCKIERQVEQKGKVAVDVRYAITSRLGMSAEELLRRVRGHWAIENRLHWVRDETFGEDASQVRKGSAPQVMAALRNVVLALLRLAGVKNVAAALRENGWRRGASIKFLGLCA